MPRTSSLLPVLVFALASACHGGPSADWQDPTPDVTGTTPLVAQKLLARVAATNAGDWDTWQGLHTHKCVRTAPELNAPIETAAGMREAIERLGHAFPDYHVALVRAVGQGPWVAALFQAQGTMKHALMVPGGPAIPPTGRAFHQTWTAFIRFDGELIAEFHEHYDQTDLNNQLLGLGKAKSW